MAASASACSGWPKSSSTAVKHRAYRFGLDQDRAAFGGAAGPPRSARFHDRSSSRNRAHTSAGAHLMINPRTWSASRVCPARPRLTVAPSIHGTGRRSARRYRKPGTGCSCMWTATRAARARTRPGPPWPGLCTPGGTRTHRARPGKAGRWRTAARSRSASQCHEQARMNVDPGKVSELALAVAWPDRLPADTAGAAGDGDPRLGGERWWRNARAQGVGHHSPPGASSSSA